MMKMTIERRIYERSGKGRVEGDGNRQVSSRGRLSERGGKVE